jgi:hypothetical protein
MMQQIKLRSIDVMIRKLDCSVFYNNRTEKLLKLEPKKIHKVHFPNFIEKNILDIIMQICVVRSRQSIVLKPLIVILVITLNCHSWITGLYILLRSIDVMIRKLDEVYIITTEQKNYLN